MAANNSADAEAQQAIAEAEAEKAETARMNAVMYAGMVADAKIAADNEADGLDGGCRRDGER